MIQAAPLIELRGLRKQFGDCVANEDIHLSIESGSIHAIIGENGAGKSTAMKMLYGMYPPTSGEIRLRGKCCVWSSPSDAIAAGIGMVHQHFMLAYPFSVLDNILLGAEASTKYFSWLPRALRPIDRASAREKLRALMDRYGLPVELDAPIHSLPVGLQQRVEILKLLFRDSEILILDEPTAVLTPREIDDLFRNLRRLREEGKTILIITHKLKEVMALADRVSVFRSGRVVGEAAIPRTSVEAMAEMMVGRKVMLRVDAEKPCKPKEQVLGISGLNVFTTTKKSKRRIRDLSLSVRSGEIVGIAGVEGNGQSELIRSILFAGAPDAAWEGKISLFGKDLSRLSPRQVRALGVGVLAEDRLRESLLSKNPLWENFLLGHHWSGKFQRFGLLRTEETRGVARECMERYDVRPRDIHAFAGSLSGGNQQKFVVARELMHEPRFLIAAQPTRGVDVGAIEFIHRKIFAARDSGAAVLLISSELDEILSLSDRILVMFEGAVAAEFPRGQAREKEIGYFMGGGAR